MARDLSEIVKDLQSAITDVDNKSKTQKQTEEAYKAASLEHRNAQDKASALKMELESVFNAFIPTDAQGRVRSSQ